MKELRSYLQLRNSPASSELGYSFGVLLRVTETLFRSRIAQWYEVFEILSRGWGGVGSSRALALPFLEGAGPAVGGGGTMCVGAGAGGRAGVGADPGCDRSRIEASRSAIPYAGCWSWVAGSFASCEEISWGSSLRFSFSSEMVASTWLTPLTSCEMVTTPWTSGERRVIIVASEGMVPARVSAVKSERSWVLRRRALLA